ncbi:hypothetical protein [Phaeocystidibacter marisrubri]|uniref:Peptidase MA-like domain-containing protein n=1 Tax=Phaeocystidibacter marisrubri TaxID=1577780 RepID=A0A6L3ZFC6_9FLAO|nr:hypothetical protein [Phaeocystidibacter marisrubri]KAB2816316.1 hypothetical protein F8C82_11570 [Phaeocystidibacter marisrubri]GGH68417.1 hypothetical protein GCM10011318_08420 [Phaeocystidibacter marisrubri]
MMKISTYSSLAILFLAGCQTESPTPKTDYGDWAYESTVVKTVDSHEFTFPTEGYAFEHRDEYVQECVDAIAYNCKLLAITEFTVPIKYRFVTSREEMARFTGIAASGTTNSWTRTIHMAVFDSTETTTDEVLTDPPIVHETMHMISQVAWGHPGQKGNWINEGLATYAAGTCSGWTPREMYRFFMENEMLASVDSMITDFYHVGEMVGYHQAAVWVEHMISRYGLETFQQYWNPQNTMSFDEIFGVSIAEMETRINEDILKEIPEVPAIDWEVLQEGCYTRLNS